MLNSTTVEHVNVLVVGGGQAGLATAAALHARGVAYRVLDAGPWLGWSWERRWDSLRLFTPRAVDALPGLAFPGPPWTHPGKDEVARYLRAYASTLGLRIEHGVRVERLARASDGGFEATWSRGTVSADRVVVATGAFGRPYTPRFAAELSPDTAQVHTDDYTRPAALPGDRVLVVGAGNSGAQIALELATAGRRVELSTTSRLRGVPQRVLGRDLFWWLARTRALSAAPDSTIGRRLRDEPLVGTRPVHLARARVRVVARAVSAGPNGVLLSDSSTTRPDAVVWATGYQHDDRWIDVPGALDDTGILHAPGGVGRVTGLYTIGRSWQTSRGSALLGYVSRDVHQLLPPATTSTLAIA